MREREKERARGREGERKREQEKERAREGEFAFGGERLFARILCWEHCVGFKVYNLLMS